MFIRLIILARGGRGRTDVVNVPTSRLFAALGIATAFFKTGPFSRSQVERMVVGEIETILVVGVLTLKALPFTKADH